MTASVALASALDAWRARWPEWNVGASFVAASGRETAFAWLALLQTFTDAAWGGADPTPGLAKLAWWHEELQGWAKGARRHPLGEALQRVDADWTTLAHGLRALPAVRERAPLSASAIAAPGDDDLGAFALALARVEQVLFAGEGGDRVAAAAAPGIAADLHAERALLFADAEFARAPHAEREASAALPRRLQSAFLHERLRRLAAGAAVAPASPGRSLRLAWRAARARR